jgi:hypothetical protein
VDFLVRPAQFERACGLLIGLGFDRVAWAPGRLATERTFHEAGFTLDVGDGRRILFEAHRQLVQPARHPIDHAALWARSRPSTFDGAPCRRLCADDHLLHGVVHLLSHQFVDPARGLRDLELLILSGAVDLDAVEARAREWECARATWLALSLLRERGAVPALDRRIARLAPPFPARLAARLLVPDARGFRFERLGDRGRELALWAWLLDGVRPALRFGAYYARLRRRDLAAALAHRRDALAR